MLQFDSLISTVSLLRRKCPWDRAQTLNSIRSNIIEEAYELVDSINKKDGKKIEEEIGDLLLQSIFAPIIARDEGFDISIKSVINSLLKKLVSHHPHIFSKKERISKEEILKRWTRRKKNPLDIPPMPSLLYSQNYIKRIKRLNPNGNKKIDEIKKLLSEKLDETIRNIKNKAQKRYYLDLIVISSLLYCISNDEPLEAEVLKHLKDKWIKFLNR